MAAISRMQFLRGRFREAEAVLRPPWALAEEKFAALCTRCDACLPACPTGIVKRGSAGFPEVDFRAGECTFCGECVSACPTPALDRSARESGLAPWSLVARIGEACLALNKVVCRSCGDVCEPRAIRFRLALGGVALPHLEATACTGCGACVSVCPVAALSVFSARPMVEAEAA